jgi:Mce-associated membrane protein
MTILRENTESDATGDEEMVNADAEDPAGPMSQDIEPPAKDDTAQEESVPVEADDEPDDEEADSGRERRPIAWSRVFAYGVLPGVALLVALAAGYFTWVDESSNAAALARSESVRVASEDAVAMLSYRAESVDRDLASASERLTGSFKDAYGSLIREVVIPGAKEKHISAVAKVNAAASVSATANHAVVMLFLNQTVTIGDGIPTDTSPVVRVVLDKVNGRWLVSHFDPE